MENARIKEILMDIAPTELDFTVTQTGKESKRVNGLYSPDTHEILLHNKNFKTDNQLIYAAPGTAGWGEATWWAFKKK